METYITGKFQGLLDEIFASLTDKPGRVIAVVPGNQVAWDNCCDGQLTARLVSMTPVLNPGSTLKQCSIKYWQAVGELVLLRCSQALDEEGNAPKPAIVKAEGVSSLNDTEVLAVALANQDWISSIGNWVPQGPQGGCRGVQILFNFVVDQP